MSLLPKKAISLPINIRLKLVEKKQTQIVGTEESFVIKVDVEFGY